MDEFDTYRAKLEQYINEAKEQENKINRLNEEIDHPGSSFGVPILEEKLKDEQKLFGIAYLNSIIYWNKVNSAAISNNLYAAKANLSKKMLRGSTNHIDPPNKIIFSYKTLKIIPRYAKTQDKKDGKNHNVRYQILMRYPDGFDVVKTQNTKNYIDVFNRLLNENDPIIDVELKAKVHASLVNTVYYGDDVLKEEAKLLLNRLMTPLSGGSCAQDYILNKMRYTIL